MARLITFVFLRITWSWIPPPSPFS